jgi:hypothetical protein
MNTGILQTRIPGAVGQRRGAGLAQGLTFDELMFRIALRVVQIRRVSGKSPNDDRLIVLTLCCHPHHRLRIHHRQHAKTPKIVGTTRKSRIRARIMITTVILTELPT